MDKVEIGATLKVWRTGVLVKVLHFENVQHEHGPITVYTDQGKYGIWELDHTSFCADCGCDTREIGEYNYLLLDDIWEQIWPGTTFESWDEMEGKYILCIACAEKRLGR